jgi:hypothetical protein
MWYSIGDMGRAKDWWLIVIILAITLIVGWKEKRCQAQAYQCRAAYAAQSQSEGITLPLTVYQQASKQEAVAAACEPNGYFCRLFGAANLPTVLLVFVGIGGIFAALRTLATIERQTSLQSAAMSQWLNVGNWVQVQKFNKDTNEGYLEVSFQLVNPTNYPLTINDLECSINGHSETKRLNYRLVPGPENAHWVRFNTPFGSTDGNASYQRNNFALVVEMALTFKDILGDVQPQAHSRYGVCGPNYLDWRDQINPDNT